MPILKDFFKTLADKAGVKADNKALLDLLNNPALTSIEIPDDVSQEMDRALISIDSAKNDHSSIKQHYFARAYNGLDKTVLETMDELEVPEEIRKKVNAETSSTKKAALLTKELAKWEREQKKSGDQTPAEVEALRKSINDANEKLTNKDAELTRTKERYEKKIKDIHKDQELSTIFGKYQTTLDKLSPTAKRAAIKALLDDTLVKKGAVIDVDDDGLPILKKKDGTNYHDDKNILVPLDKFIESAFVENNILLQNNGGNPRDGRSGFQNQNYNRREQNSNRSERSSAQDVREDNNQRLNSRAASLIDETLNKMSNPGPSTSML